MTYTLVRLCIDWLQQKYNIRTLGVKFVIHEFWKTNS